MAVQLILCVVAVVALAHLLVGRIPDWLFVFLPCIFFVPDLFYMGADYLSAASNLAIAISAAITLGVLIRGINDWRIQAVATRDYDFAVKFLSEVYEWQSAFRALRINGYDNDEYRLEFFKLGGSVNRYFFMGKAIWQDDFFKCKQAVLDCVNKYSLNVRLQKEGAPDHEIEIINTVSISPWEDDSKNKFSVQIREAVEGVERELKPRIQELRRALKA